MARAVAKVGSEKAEKFASENGTGRSEQMAEMAHAVLLFAIVFGALCYATAGIVFALTASISGLGYLPRPEEPTSPMPEVPTSTRTIGSTSTTTVGPTTTTKPISTGPTPVPPGRLPKSIAPINYAITLQPTLSEPFPLYGKVDIDIMVRERVNEIHLHADEMNISVAKIDGKNVSEVIKKPDRRYLLTLNNILEVGRHKLWIEFQGTLNPLMRGFYRTRNVAPNGTIVWAAATQFESTSARYAFPCWDEPAFKATFDVTLVVPKDRVALSNMQVLYDEPDPQDSNLRRVTYDRSPLMPTYLLAFAVGYYEYLETHDETGIITRIYTPVKRVEEGTFSLTVAKNTTEFFRRYFGIAYPLRKLDHIAITDFAAGAMENWGLITYREILLLVNNATTDSQVFSVARVIAHEVGHQWFGNLVTMEWWNHIWLNEGFATWVSYLFLADNFRSWDPWTNFVGSETTAGFNADHQKTGKPIIAEGSGNNIIYQKAGSVLRMINHYIGSETMKKGLNIYLKRFNYQNTITSDLWQALEDASGEPIGRIFNTWTSQQGYPIIIIEKSNYNNGTLSLQIKQQKFNLFNSSTSINLLWEIPVSAKISGNRTISFLFNNETLSVMILNMTATKWISFNFDSCGFYRVKYTVELQNNLINGIRDGSLPLRERMSFLNDMFMSARAGLQSSIDVLKLSLSFKDEDTKSQFIWRDLIGNLDRVSLIVSERDNYTTEKVLFERFVQNLLPSTLEKLGYIPRPGEPEVEANLRIMLISRLGINGHRQTINETRRQFEEHVQGSNSIHVNLRQSIYAVVAFNGDSVTVDQLIDLYNSTQNGEEKTRILRVIGYVGQQNQKLRILNLILTSNITGGTDVSATIAGVSNGRIGRETAWEWIRTNWDALLKQVDNSLPTMRNIIQVTFDGFAREKYGVELENLIKDRKLDRNTYIDVFNNLELNIAHQKRDGDKIAEYLSNL